MTATETHMSRVDILTAIIALKSIRDPKYADIVTTIRTRLQDVRERLGPVEHIPASKEVTP
jgi:hypothetical protein